MKEKTWKHISILLLIVSICFFTYSVFSPVSDSIKTIKQQPITVTKTGVEKITLNPGILSDSPKLLSPPDGSGLEVIQNKYNAGLTVCVEYRAWGQTLVFDETKHVTGIGIGIARKGTPSDYIAIGIGDNKYPIFHKKKYITFDDVPEENTVYWCEYIFGTPWVVNEGEKLVLMVATGAPYDANNYWMWAISTQNPYPDGRIIQKSSDGSKWDYPSDYADWDGTFYVYTQEAAVQPPSISISMNAGSLALGTLTLLGAILAGIRYGILIGML